MTLRIAVAARSATHEKEDVTTGAAMWDVGDTTSIGGTVDCGASRCLPLRLDHAGDDWKRYRYKVFETLVPLRNVLWKS